MESIERLGDEWKHYCKNIELGFGFHILDNKMYKVETDGIRNVNDNVNDNGNDNGNAIYDLSGRKVNSQLKKGIYVVGSKKVVK